MIFSLEYAQTVFHSTSFARDPLTFYANAVSAQVCLNLLPVPLTAALHTRAVTAARGSALLIIARVSLAALATNPGDRLLILDGAAWAPLIFLRVVLATLVALPRGRRLLIHGC